MDIQTFFKAKDKPTYNPDAASSTRNTGATASASVSIESPATCTVRKDEPGAELGGNGINQLAASYACNFSSRPTCIVLVSA